MNILEIKKSLIIIWLLVICSCSNNAIIINDVKISFPGNNVLSALVELNTKDYTSTYLQYSEVGTTIKSFISQTSKQKKEHKFFLKKLKPGTQYKLNVIITKNKNKRFSKNYFFKTVGFYGEKQDSFQVVCADTSILPTIFKNGFVMIHRREAPGIIAVVNAQGNIVWHHQSKNEGYKVVNYTPGKTFLCIMGSKDYETSYGRAILELSVSGDTLLYLKKGQNDFQQTIHHDVLLNKKKQIVSLCVENRILDLRSRGGSGKDTVKGDGILVLDREGNKVWKWTVFDEIDPLQDQNILKNKKDWMHANSLSFDKDGNYLVSFYNNGQIWKIDASTGKVIWKLGKGGDFEMPGRANFDQAHAVHINQRGWMMFFDNGTENRLSRSVALMLNEDSKKSEVVVDTWLPPQFFSDRMGSSYLVGDTSLLLCASKQKTVLLTNFTGSLLWQLRSNGITSYRAQFIPKENFPM